jgi:hypothetical protein
LPQTSQPCGGRSKTIVNVVGDGYTGGSEFVAGLLHNFREYIAGLSVAEEDHVESQDRIANLHPEILPKLGVEEHVVIAGFEVPVRHEILALGEGKNIPKSLVPESEKLHEHVCVPRIDNKPSFPACESYPQRMYTIGFSSPSR